MNLKWDTLNHLVPSWPHYGHYNVRNANSRESMKNWNFSFEVQICPYTLHTFLKKKFSIWNCTTIKIPINKTQKYCKYLKIQEILTNTTHVLCSISCVWKFVILFYFFGLCSLVHVPLMYVPILINLPTLFILQRIIFVLNCI